MSASATRPKSVDQPTPPVTTPEAKADAEVKLDVQASAKGEAKGKEAEKQPEISPDADSYVLNRPYAEEWVDPDKYHAEFFIGPSFYDFSNGKGIYSDHSGISTGLDLRIKFPFAQDNAFYASAGLRYQYENPSYDLDPGTSALNMHTIGAVAGLHWRAVPEWLSVGIETYLGPTFMSSDCEMDGEGFCDGESGTVYNLNAQAYPTDSAGFNTGLAARVGIWRDIVNVRFGFNKVWGGTGDIETATQGTFSQPFAPAGSSLQFGINIMPLFSAKTWSGSTYSGDSGKVHMGHLDKPEGTGPDGKTPADGKAPTGPKPDGVNPGAPTKSTPADLAKQFAGHKSNIAAARDRVKAIYETDLKDTSKAAASVFGGEEKKQAKMKALVDEAKSKGLFAQVEYMSAKTLLTQWEKAVADMPAGEAKTAAQKDVDAAKDEFKVQKGSGESALELNHDAYKYTKLSVDYYNGYAGRTKGVDKTDFDLERPEGYSGKVDRPRNYTPPAGGGKTPAKPVEKPTEKPTEKPGGKVPAIDIPGMN